MNRLLAFTTLGSFLAVGSDAALARGGSCHSTLCSLSGGLVLLVLLLFFVASVAGAIKKKGVIRGLSQHAGVQAFALYIGLFVGVPCILLASVWLIGKEETIVLGGIAWALLMWRYFFHKSSP